MAGQDVLSEMLTGERGAVKCIGKLYIMPTMSQIDDMPLVMIAGSAVSPCGGKLVLPENEKWSEMWECEIIIIPKRKYSGTLKEARGNRFKDKVYHPYAGYRVDQVLTSHFGDPKVWGPEYFESIGKEKKNE